MIATITAGLLALSGTAYAGTTTYNLSKGDLYVKVYKDTTTLAASQAHNHLIQAKNWGGSLVFDQDDPSSCVLSIYLPVNDMIVDETSGRARLGGKKEFTNSISESQRKEVRKNMLSKGQLNGSKHEYITFDQTGSACTSKGDGLYDISGKFNLRGVSKNVVIKNASIKVDGDKVKLKGGFTVKATDHGFKPYKALLGAVANQNKMLVKFNVSN